jgi:AcrR family transcriptional regulator
MGADSLPRRRISQRERRETAERKLLEATVAILTDRGYAATTTLEVQKQSGLSRGVLLHYYSSRSELIAAAVRHLYATRIDEIRVHAAQLEAEKGEDWVTLLWQVFSGPLGRASLELLAVARHDAEMTDYLVPLEREFGRANLELCRTLLGEERAAHPRFREFCVVLVTSMLGAAAQTVVAGSAEEERLLRTWRRLPDIYLLPEA